MRTHTCGQLRAADTGKEVTLCGWVETHRIQGQLSFILLRDRYGITQVFLNSDLTKEIKELRRETVIQITGKVVKRPEGQNKKELATGEVEISAEKIKVINKSEPLPLEPGIESSEEIKHKYRYIDLRSEKLQNNLLFRHKVLTAAREHLNNNNFIEIETPMLVKPTPEGARDYVVPSRVNKGRFYALPQSPQLYKQILMVAGFDRYYQVARCLRDEDLRSDRQPEHTQIDMEMSFMTSDQIRAQVESLIKDIFKKTMNIELKDFPTFSYKETMERFGTDKPDLRFGLELIDLTETAKKANFELFEQAETIKCLAVDEEFSRKKLEKLVDFCKIYKTKLLYTKAKDILETGIAKNIPETVQKEIIKLTGKGTLFIIADKKKRTETTLGFLRNKLRDDLDLVKGKEKEFLFSWIKDFPLFSYDEEKGKWEPEHHMFSMPKEEFVDDFEKRPGEVLGDLWDLALNGVEMLSGSIRVSNPEIQERIMNFVGFDKKEANKKFGFLLESYKYGGPVHGGVGIGLDRLVAMMLGYTDIREVIAFPKNKNAECLMDGSPSIIDKDQLDELHIDLKK